MRLQDRGVAGGCDRDYVASVGRKRTPGTLRRCVLWYLLPLFIVDPRSAAPSLLPHPRLLPAGLPLASNFINPMCDKRPALLDRFATATVAVPRSLPPCHPGCPPICRFIDADKGRGTRFCPGLRCWCWFWYAGVLDFLSWRSLRSLRRRPSEDDDEDENNESVLK